LFGQNTEIGRCLTGHVNVAMPDVALLSDASSDRFIRASATMTAYHASRHFFGDESNPVLLNDSMQIFTKLVQGALGVFVFVPALQ
jgi:hypothetical protein